VVGTEKIIGMIRITLEKDIYLLVRRLKILHQRHLRTRLRNRDPLIPLPWRLPFLLPLIVNPCLYDWFLPICRPNNGKEYAS
jgi:hypothetical protein